LYSLIERDVGRFLKVVPMVDMEVYGKSFQTNNYGVNELSRATQFHPLQSK
jgi:hypothetical protein